MNLPNAQTVGLSYGLSTAMCLLVLARLWRLNRHRFHGLHLWLADFALQVVAVGLAAGRGTVPDLLAIVVADLLVVGGTLLLYLGLEQFVGRPGRQVHNIALLAAFAGVQAYFTYLAPSQPARHISLSLALLLIFFQCGWLLRRRAEAGLRPLTLLPSAVFGVYILIGLSHVVGGAAALAAASPSLSNNLDVVITLFYQIMIVGLTFSLVLMVNARAEQTLQKAEAAAQASEARLQMVLENQGEGTGVVDADETFIFANPAADAIFGVPPGSLIGRNLRDFTTPEEFERMRQQSAARAAGAKGEYEVEINRPAGDKRRLLVTATPNLEPGGRYAGAFGVFRDVTERQLAEEALRESEARFRGLFDNSLDGVALHEIVLNAQGEPVDYIYLMANPAFETQTGMRVADILGKRVTQTHPDIEKSGLIPIYGKVALTGEPVTFETYFEPLRRHFSIVVFQVGYGRFAVVFEDISARKAMEMQLRESETRFQLAMEAAQDGLWDWNVRTGQDYLSPAYFQMLGYPPGHLPQQVNTWMDLIHPDDREQAQDANNRCIENQTERFAVEFRMRAQDGAWKWILSKGKAVVRDGAGRALRMVGTHTDITTRKEMEEALRQERAHLAERVEARTAELSARSAELQLANAELQRANRLKDDFLANMSHELRTPLTAILGLAESLQMGSYGPLTDKQAKMLQVIRESGQHLLALINDILDLSKIEAGKLELQMTPTAASDICQIGLQFIRQAALKKSIRLTYHHDPLVRLLVADPRRLKQMLVNLLNNAVKFTPENGEVSLEVIGDADRREVRFSVSDTGIGIPPEKQPLLFQPFVQVDGSLTRRYEGAGLGLALTRRLAELHGGRVSVHSIGADRGSRFSIILPWQPVGTPTRLPPESSPTARSFVQALGRAPFILVADDNDTILTTIGDYLEALSARVMTANSGPAALAQAQAERPDIILMDVQMPEMDGLEVIRQLRAIPATAQIPMVAVTAAAMPGDRERCLAAGANAYLSKPLSLPELERTIVTLLKAASGA